MKFDRCNKFHFCYYGQVNSLRVKLCVASKYEVNTFGGNIYFAGDVTNDNGAWAIFVVLDRLLLLCNGFDT